MVKKTPKSVSQEDLEVWKKITIQLKRNKPEVLIKKNISGLKIKKSSKSLPKAPELKPFIIGEKVLKKEKINWNIIQTPMFLNSRDEFKNYLAKSKKPFMVTFYKEVRKKSGILMGADGNPIGGKWSFDEDNRNKLPKDVEQQQCQQQSAPMKQILNGLDELWAQSQYDEEFDVEQFQKTFSSGKK